jgi:putative ABC transport system ATP-binding protein
VDGYGQTTIMVTHDQRAAAIADRVLFLADGEIDQPSQHAVLDALEEVTGTRPTR